MKKKKNKWGDIKYIMHSMDTKKALLNLMLQARLVLKYMRILRSRSVMDLL